MEIFLYPSHCAPDPTVYFFFFGSFFFAFFFGRVCWMGRLDGSFGCSVIGSSGVGLPRKGAPVRGGRWAMDGFWVPEKNRLDHVGRNGSRG
jgi:hypothetical protein